MATLSVAQVRQRIATALEAVSGWHESTVPGELFPKEGTTIEHKAFTAFGQTTAWEGVEQAPRRRSSGSLTDTAVLVRWTYQIRLDNAVVDVDAATDAEQLLIQAALAATATDLHVRVERATRLVGEGTAAGAYVAGEIKFICKHLFDQTV